jgi:hypothetical protein
MERVWRSEAGAGGAHQGGYNFLIANTAVADEIEITIMTAAMTMAPV